MKHQKQRIAFVCFGRFFDFFTSPFRAEDVPSYGQLTRIFNRSIILAVCLRMVLRGGDFGVFFALVV